MGHFSWHIKTILCSWIALFYGVRNVRYNSFFIGRKNRKMFFFMDSQISQYSFWVLLMLPFLSWEKIILYYVRYSVAKFITTQFYALIILFFYMQTFANSFIFFFGSSLVKQVLFVNLLSLVFFKVHKVILSIKSYVFYICNASISIL